MTRNTLSEGVLRIPRQSHYFIYKNILWHKSVSWHYRSWTCCERFLCLKLLDAKVNLQSPAQRLPESVKWGYSHISIPRRHAVNQIATMNKRYVAGKIALYDITHGTKLHGSFGGARSLKTCRWFMGSLWWAILVSVSVGLTSLAFNKAFPFDRLVNDTTKLLILTRIRII